MKKALFLFYERSHTTELIRVARLLKKGGKVTPIFLFSRILALSDEFAHTCLSEHFECFDNVGSYIDLSKIGWREKVIKDPQVLNQGFGRNLIGVLMKMQGRIIRKNNKIRFPPAKTLLGIFSRGIGGLITVLDAISRLAFQKKIIQDILDKIAPDVILMAEDNVYFDTALWIKVGKARHVSSVIIPYTISNSLEQAESALYDTPLLIDSLEKKIVARLFHRWVYTHQDTPLLRLPWFQVIAREFLRLVPPNPWVLNSGPAAAIAVESKAMQRYYLNEGFPLSQLVVTGTIADDEMTLGHRNIVQNKNELINQLGLDTQEKIILMALPPNQFPRHCEFPDYQVLIQSMITAADNIDGWNLVVRPHPKQTAQDFSAISINKGGITWIDTARLIPLCELYIASASATIRWAIACGIPVINYDVYSYHYTDYQDISDVLYADQLSTYVDLLKKTTGDTVFYKDIQLQQQQIMGEWGTLDGKGGQRIESLIERLIEHSKIRSNK